MTDLAKRRCVSLKETAAALTPEERRPLLEQVQGWQTTPDGTVIFREFQFRDFFETMSFVNGVAHIANREGHHPDLEVSWGRCRVCFSSHVARGLTENDFICAAKVDALL